MKYRQSIETVALAMLVLVANGLVIAVLTMVEAEAGERTAAMPPIVVEPAKSATLPELMTKLRNERLVYVGETHTAYGDHVLQLDVLRAMAAHEGELAVGVEWFQARFQPVLDDYLAGRISEAEFLRDTEYYERWRFDYRLYRPIVRFARENGIPIIALNADQELTSEIRRVGIDGLSGELRRELPDDYDFSDKTYEELLREIFDLHQSEDAQFQRFLEVQLTWDESMAQRVAAYLQQHPAGRILVLAGKGHVSTRAGIPARVTRRTGIRGTTIVTFSPSSTLSNEADYLVLANDENLPPAGLMGVFLDEREDGVFVKGFGHDSPAQQAGVSEGDLIVSIDGQPIHHFADVKIQTIDKLPGDEIELTYSHQRVLLGPETRSARFKLAGESPH